MKVFNKKAKDSDIAQLDTVDVGVTKTSQPFSRPVLAAIVVAVLAMLGFLTYQLVTNNQNNDDPIVFVINGKEFRASLVNPYLDAAEQVHGLNRQEAQDGLIESMKRQIAAEDYNLEISDQQIREALKTSTYAEQANQSEPLDLWVEAVGYRIAVDDYIKKQSSQSKKGYAFIFHFGSLIAPTDGTTLEEFGDLPDIDKSMIGNQELIDSDKAYAKQEADRYHQQLTDGVDPETVLAEARNDNKLNLYYIDGGSSSVKFGDNPGETWQDTVSHREVVEAINGYTETNIPSEVSTGKVAFSNNPTEDDFKEAFYYFVYLTGFSSQAQDVQKAIESMKVENS